MQYYETENRMSYLLISLAILLTSCQALPQLFQTADDVVTDDAITVQVDRDAINQNTDVSVNVEVKNKNPKE